MKPPEELLADFLKENNLEIVPANPIVTFTSTGGCIVEPRFGVKKDETAQDKV